MRLGMLAALLTWVGCGDKDASAPQAAEPAARPAPVIAPPPSARPAGSGDLPAPAAAEDDDDLHDAPHVDRRLRLQIEPEADVVAGAGFAIEGVPDDVAVYWPVTSASKNVYVVYDEGFDHIATIEERPRPDGVAAADLDAGALEFTATSAFAVWPCSFAATQTKQGPGKRTTFRGTTHDYAVEVLVEVPWLFEGFTFR